MATAPCQPWMPRFGPSITSVGVRAGVGMSPGCQALLVPRVGVGKWASPQKLLFHGKRSAKERQAVRQRRWQEGRGSPAFNPSHLRLPSGGATGPTPSGAPRAAT